MSIRTTRRDLLKSAGAFAFAPMAGRLFASDEKPLFRMGVMTDTHVGTTLESCSRVKAALELFKAHRVDIIANNGDIADHFYPSGYRALRSIYSSTYPNPSERPREVWVYAWHDAFEFKKDVPREDTVKHAPEAFAEVRRLLEARDPVTASFTFRGIPMLVFNQFDASETFERMIAKAAAENPGKPIFVFSHVPPAGTIYNSWNWGEARQREIFSKWPQVVDFSGHVHGSLRNDLFIWQKEFTVINSGCLQVWGGIPVNDDRTRSKQAYGVLTVDVFPSRLLVRRFDVRDGSEIEPERPWNVALPFSADNATHTPDLKKARAAVPEYPPGARLDAKAAANGEYELSFPEVQGATRAFIHRAEIARLLPDGSWRRFAVRDTFGDFYLNAAEATRTITFQAGYFTPGEHVRFTVCPLNGYGVSGKPITAECKIAAREDFQTVFDVDGLAEGFKFSRSADSGPFKPDAYGFYAPRCAGCILSMPKDAFNGPAQTRFRLICDLDMQQPEEGSMWEIGVKAATAAGRPRSVHTMPGSPGTLRHVFEFTKTTDAPNDYVLLFRRGAKSKIRFAHIRLERSAAPA